MAHERNALTDDELVSDFVRGDELAFEELVLRYKNSLYQYILVMTGDEGSAGDLFQEVFLSVYKNASKYQAQGKFKAWLFRLARNRVLNYFRDRDPLFSLDQTDEEGKEPLHEILPSGEELPLETLERAELAQDIRRAAEALPPKQREIIYLRQYMSFKEIAEALNLPLGTVLATGHRAIKKLQHILLKNREVVYETVR